MAVRTKSKRSCRSLTEEEAAAASLAGVLLNLSDGLGAEDARGVLALERIAEGLQRAVAAAVVVELVMIRLEWE